MIVNRQLARRVLHFHLSWVSGMPTHAQQTITVSSGALAPCPVWQPTKGVPSPAPNGPTVDASWKAASDTLLPACTAALAGGNVDCAWQALSSLAMAFHCHQAQVEAPSGPRPGGTVSWQRPEPRNVGEGDAADGLVAVIARRERRLRELTRLWPDGIGSLPFRTAGIHRALIDAAPHGSEWQRSLVALRSKPQAETLLKQAQEELRLALAELRQGRRDRWHSWCASAMARKSGPFFRWIRNGPQQVTFPAARSEGESGAAADLRATEEWWWNLWSPKIRKAPLVEQWLLPLDRLTPFPALLDITADQLRQAIRRAPSGKAPGSDGWRYSELKAWPLQLIQQLCHVCHLIERTGKWPLALSTSLVTLLPKGASGHLDDYRPIVLLSAIYRLWVGLRMRTF